LDIGVSANFPWFGPKFTDLAKHMEALGFESLWTGEHIIIPVDIADPYRYGVPLPTNYKHMPDPFISMAAAAAVTSKLKFGMDVCLVTQRDPLVLAKEAATLDRVSDGRLIIGIGYGWIKEESEIFGVPWNTRVRRSSEMVLALKKIWAEETPSFSGEFINFPAVHSNPKPVRPGGVPLLIGSGGTGLDNGRALRRVAEIADGWVPSMLTPQEMRDDLARLKQLCAETGRDFEAMDITLIVPAISFGLGERPEWAYDLPTHDKDELLAQYKESGVNRLIIGMDDMVDDTSFKNLEVVAKGFGLV
jgi:probable F420-dependent oxidoreductase